MRPMPSAARNVLLITSDQQHWNTLGCLNPEIRTPNLDRLAAGGTLFTRAYCPNPTCTPTRASIITGKYPSQHGAWSLGTRLPESEHTVGEDCRRPACARLWWARRTFQPLAGNAEHPSLEAYPTLQDLAFGRRFHGPFYGFEHVELARNHTDEAHVGQHYALWMEQRGLDNWRDYFRPPTGTNDRQRRTWQIPEAFHYGTWIAERCCELLDAVWYGRCETLRDHVLVENRHEPTTIHLRTFIDERYKLTIYFNRDYGELFDLVEDPQEVSNLWDVPAARDLKNDLIRRLLHAELGREPLPMPRIAGA